MIKVFYTSFSQEFPSAVMAASLNTLPEAMQQSIGNYRRWQDRQRVMLGKLLLQTGLRDAGLPPEALEWVRRDCHDRPCIGPELDFNISHSGNIVVCALAREQRVGVDIEEIRPLELGDFESAFSRAEWRRIHQAISPHHVFFHLWTQKESVLKGDGRGLTLSPAKVEPAGMMATLEGASWSLAPLWLGDDYSCHLATANGPLVYTLNHLDCNQLLRDRPKTGRGG